MFNIGIVGPGLVGGELIVQLKNYISSKPNSLAVTAIINSTRMLLNPNSQNLDLAAWKDSLAKGLPADLAKFADHLAAGPNHSIIIDCTSSDFIAEQYPLWLEKGISVVTPNKKGFSGDLSLYKKILSLTSGSKGPFVYHEATVGAGLPVLSTLNDLVKTGDRIVKIEGIFSGTLSYLFNNYSTLDTSVPRLDFSKIVQVAKDNGFTEPDPRDDLNGMDVARKVAILGRVAGLDVSLETLSVENIVPEELRSVATAEEFMQKLPQFDSHFAKLNESALANDEVLRYVGVVDPNGESSVKLMRYPASHPFASLKGSDNIIAFTTERFPNPLIVQGAGAGAAVTAFGIFSDILKITERLSSRL
ncbi:Homoserine dehydrogenase [Basidiobolus ranarum]|uniref:Homoserine dehydrogenase n=1 Tax=Basidiobolus ranarum TaxID=34480 RepID=A0ABR2W817_9FUNG